MKTSRLFFSFGALLLIAAPPCFSDVLVTRDGNQIETRGPYEVEGRRIVFTTSQGTLSAIRTSEVDLAASEAATKKATQPKPAPAAATEPKKAVLVLGEGSVAKHRPAPPTPTEEDDEEVIPGRVEVSNWSESQDPGEELQISGKITNNSDQFATDITLKVTAYDQDGQPAETRQANLAKNSLVRDGTTTFMVDFPDLFITNGATFEITNRGFVTQSRENEPDEGSDESEP